MKEEQVENLDESKLKKEDKKKLPWKKRIKQLGWGAFLFFFIKGLVWLAIFFGLGKWIKDMF